jgi:hypothetical protein
MTGRIAIVVSAPSGGVATLIPRRIGMATEAQPCTHDRVAPSVASDRKQLGTWALHDQLLTGLLVTLASFIPMYDLFRICDSPERKNKRKSNR